MKEALRPLIGMETHAREIYAATLKEWEAHKVVERERKKLRAEKIKKDLKADRNADEIAIELAEEQDERPPPIRRRFMTNDTTIERLGELLRDNPNGILLFRDELMGWLRSMEREGHQSDRQFYLEAWDGSSRFSTDRIVRGNVETEAACVSVFGGIPPAPFLAYLEAIAWTGAGADGLLQRLQLMVWPDIPPAWRNVDRWPDDAARDRVEAVFRRLAAIKDIGAVGKGRVPGLRFNDAAQEAFDSWRLKHETSLRNDPMHEAFGAHLGKFRSLVPSIALICHLTDGETGPVNAVSFARAEAWAEFLKSHAKRIYDSVTRADMAAAQTLGEHIRAGDLPSPFQLRDVYRPCWSGLSTKEAAQGAVDVLCDLNWLSAKDNKPAAAGGRPTTNFHINPAVRNAK